jgi:hypothetical protein
MAEMGITCSKCRRTKEIEYFHCRGKTFKTCSLCRWTARDKTTRRSLMRGMSMLTLTNNDNDSVISDDAYMSAALANLSISSSSSAAACSSANYFVEEPEPEP